MEKILKSLSDFHELEIHKLQSQFMEQIQSLQEENKSLKRELIDQGKELESFKSLYYKSLEKLKELQSNFTQKQNSWNNFKERIKQKILKKKKESQESVQENDPKQEDAKEHDQESLKQDDVKENTPNVERFAVSKLVKGNRDLSVAQGMPWAQKQKDKESRPDYAYSEVVRKKDERKRMDASDCPCCKDVF